MTPSVTNMLLSLADALAQAIYGRDGVAMPVGDELFVHQMPASVSRAEAAVLRIYGGPPPEHMLRRNRVSVQCMVTATNTQTGLDMANRIFESLHWPPIMPTGKEQLANRPRSAWAISPKRLGGDGTLEADPDLLAWGILLIDPLQPPGVLGRDETGRDQISFNFDVTFNPVAAPESDPE